MYEPEKQRVLVNLNSLLIGNLLEKRLNESIGSFHNL